MSTLYRSRSDRVVAGVAGGLGRTLRIDPILVRLFFVLLALGDGIGLLLYLILAVIMPEAPEGAEEAMAPNERVRADPERNRTLIGGGLMLLGLFFLMQTLAAPFLPRFDLGELWPLLLILAGAALLWRNHQEQALGG